MRLVLVDLPGKKREHFAPLALSRPLWELRCGITTLGEKLIAASGTPQVACFLPPYLAAAYREQTAWPVNDVSQLSGDDLLLVNARVKAAGLALVPPGPSQAAWADDGELLIARIAQQDLDRLDRSSLESLLASARSVLPSCAPPPTWNWIWDLILANPQQLSDDFRELGRSGIEGTVEQPHAIRGDRSQVFVAPGATVHPMVVLDAERGPIYIDQEAVIQPFSHVEGPCYLGRRSTLLGAKCREGMSIGPHCRVGGEVEASILQGYTNKAHDGFLGHAYVGQWVNLGALTTNSDLKNDYSEVSITLDGKTAINTGSLKLGSLIGDHTKTSVGTLLNTGTCIGAMVLIAGTGEPLPKFIPSFAWFLEGTVTRGFGRPALYETAKRAMARRGQPWTPAQEALWDEVFRLTAPARDEAVTKGRRARAARRG